MLTLEPKFRYRVANVDHMIYHGDPGTGLPKHTHMYSHVTICHQGSCCIRKQGRELVINNSHPPINLVAGEWHEIEVLESSTVFENVFEVSSE